MRIDRLRLVTAVVSILALAIFWCTTSRLMNLYDEAIPLVGAMRVASGDIPHRDFYSNYGPAPYYLLAGLFRLFGADFVVARLYDAVIKACLIGVLFYVLARSARLWLALAATLIAAIWIVDDGAYLYVIFPVMLLGLAGTWLLTPGRDGLISPRRAAGAGALTGAMALFRYDSAGFLAIAHGLAITVLLLPRVGGKISWAKVACAYVVGCLAVCAPVAVLFLLNAPLQSFIYDLFGFNAQHYGAMRKLPWPDLADVRSHVQDAAVYAPFVALAAAGLFLIRRGRRPSADDGRVRTQAEILLFSSLTASFILKGVVRVGIEHMLMAIIASLAVLTMLAEQALRANRLSGRIGVAAGAVAMAFLALAAHRLYPGFPLFKRAPAVFTSSPVAPGFIEPPFGEAAAFIAAQTRPGEKIFVGRFHHDRLTSNALIVYFAARRAPATRWHQFDSGLQTSALIQRQIIGELKHGGVRWLILENAGDELREPNASATSTGVTLLDRYIRSHYRLSRDWGVAQAWSRRP